MLLTVAERFLRFLAGSCSLLTCLVLIVLYAVYAIMHAQTCSEIHLAIVHVIMPSIGLRIYAFEYPTIYACAYIVKFSCKSTNAPKK
jgi:hypothetical protein